MLGFCGVWGCGEGKGVVDACTWELDGGRVVVHMRLCHALVAVGLTRLFVFEIAICWIFASSVLSNNTLSGGIHLCKGR